ncbi:MULTISPECIES: GNAT family N-acetyltransferase [unclassified Inquilinus]|uniref:GNAT family N-acetyltransferase n=1 Tax=unclassified Inquilinus TaxID=2645927 RepID=UPI003F920B84
MATLPLRRRPVPAGPIDEALFDFIAAHPVPAMPFDPRWGLTKLVSGPGAILDLADVAGRRVAVAVLVDTCSNVADAANFALLGIDPGCDRQALADRLLQEAEAAMPGSRRRHLEIEATDLFLDWEARLVARGYREAYRMYLMRRALDGPPPPVPPLPDGLSWGRPTEATMRSQHDAVRRAMAPVPGSSIPDFDSFAARAMALADKHGLILQGGRVAGFLRVYPPESLGGEGDVSLIGRDPEFRGGRLGDILVAESLRRLHAAGAGSAVLDVAAANDAALALYRRHGFAVSETIPVFAKAFPEAGPLESPR